jgi:preprotein translocase subunit SecG
METMLTLIHVLVALILIGLVLIQDSKGGALGIGGSTSNSLLGAGGAQTLAAKATRWIAVLFAVTSISLSIWTAKKTQSVVSGVLPVQAPVVPATTENSTGQASPTQAAPTEASPAPSAPTTTEKK